MVELKVILTEAENNILIEVPALGIMTKSNSEDKPKASREVAIEMEKDAIANSSNTPTKNGESVFWENGKSSVIWLKGV